MTHNRLFDYPFDYQSYIETRLKEFDDIEERKFAKAVLQDGLLNIIKETEKKYTALEKRVFDEIENEYDKYEIRTTIIKKSDYDPINPTWFPILEEDLKTIAIDEILEKLTQQKSVGMGLVYVEGDDDICQAVEESNKQLKGKIIMDKGEFAAYFTLKKSSLHREKINKIYKLFTQNSIFWTTLQIAHLDKCYEIVLEKVDGSVLPEMKIVDFYIDYEKLTPFINEDIIPLWNIQKIYYSCNQFPIPCIDTVNYEHEFPITLFGPENGFLIESNKEISEIRYEHDKIFVITAKETFNNWVAYRIVAQKPVASLGYTYPILTNNKQKSFIGNYAKYNKISLITKADLYRKIKELALEDFIHFVGYEIISTLEDTFKDGDMNWFIQDELFDKKSRRILLLKFEAVNKENYLNGAMVRYAVSEIQQSQAEYRCMGVLV